MKKIGGFFEFEIIEGNSVYHDNAIRLSTGRACLNYILKIMQPDKIYLPYYCCDALFDPMILNNIDFEFYALNEQLEIQNPPKLKYNDAIIYTDFFGIKTKYIKKLIRLFSDRLILDNTHSFFSRGYKTNNYSFTSARKYFGVPDGAFLYTPNNIKLNINIERNCNISIQHNVHRLIGLDDKAYVEFVEYEKTLGSDIDYISILSEKILHTIDYKEVRKKRNENFNYFRKEFDEMNKIEIDKNEFDCFCYPLLLDKSIDKKKLYNEKIYIPNLWSDTLGRKQKDNFPLECMFSQEILPLPIDHRYSIKDLQRVKDTIKKIIYE